MGSRVARPAPVCLVVEPGHQAKGARPPAGGAVRGAQSALEGGTAARPRARPSCRRALLSAGGHREGCHLYNEILKFSWPSKE